MSAAGGWGVVGWHNVGGDVAGRLPDGQNVVGWHLHAEGMAGIRAGRFPCGGVRERDAGAHHHRQEYREHQQPGDPGPGPTGGEEALPASPEPSDQLVEVDRSTNMTK